MSNQPSGKRPKNCTIDPKSPYWQYDFAINGERERGSTGARTAREAAAVVEERKARMRQRQAASLDGSGRRIREKVQFVHACEFYLAKIDVAASDDTTGYQIANLIAILCEEDDTRAISDITTGDIERFRLRRRQMPSRTGRPLKESSINREVELARRVWRYADRLGYDVGDPIHWCDVIDKSAEVERIRELTASEEDRLFAALMRINPDLRIMAEFAMLCGQRRAAVVGLTWSQVNLAAREATIMLKTKGKEKRRHTFPLTARMIEIINSQPKVSTSVFTYQCQRNAPARSDRVRRVAGQRFPFSVGGWSRQWQSALEEAGIEDFRWHDFRHTTATRLLRRVNNLKAAQVLLGHTSIDQTARYAHVFKDDLRAMMESVDQPQVQDISATITAISA